MGPRRRHGGRLRRPHRLRRRRAATGTSARRPRRHRLRGDHRRAQRHRLRRPALGRVGGRPHGPRPRRRRVRGVLQAARLRARRASRSMPPSPKARARVWRRTTDERGRLRYGMVGGGEGAFIGAVHRHAMALRPPLRVHRGRAAPPPREGAPIGRRAGPPRRPQLPVVGGDARRASSPARPTNASTSSSSSPPTTCTTRSPRRSPTPASTSSPTSPWSTRREQAEDLVAHRRAHRRRLRASPTTTPATRWSSRRRHMVQSGRLGEIRKVIVELPPGLAGDQARGRAAQSRPSGAPTPTAAGGGRLRSATSARTPRTWSRTITGLEIERDLRRPDHLRPGPAARRRRQPAAALRRAAPRASWWPRRSRSGTRTTSCCRSTARPAR